MKKKYYVLQNWFNSVRPEQQFEFGEIEAEDINEAWKIVEDEWSDTNSQEWIFTI